MTYGERSHAEGVLEQLLESLRPGVLRRLLNRCRLSGILVGRFAGIRFGGLISRRRMARARRRLDGAGESGEGTGGEDRRRHGHLGKIENARYSHDRLAPIAQSHCGGTATAPGANTRSMPAEAAQSTMVKKRRDRIRLRWKREKVSSAAQCAMPSKSAGSAAGRSARRTEPERAPTLPGRGRPFNETLPD